jgi:phthiodiolone/phenolphthiodiolone dimycocerosates ketoreductase
MEDIYEIVRKLLSTDGLISHVRNHWTYENAWIGAHYPRRPELWALGGGPRLMDLATTYADGFMSMVPSAFPTAESWGAQVQTMRQDLERKGRDPESFMFGFWPFTLVYDTEEERERLLESPIVKWMSVVFGRLNHSEWAAEGIDRILPEGWHYAVKMLPHSMSREEVDDIVARVPKEMVEKSWLIGTPAEVAAQLQPFVEAGATYIAPSDLAPAVMEPEEQQRVAERTLELCAHLKGVPVESIGRTAETAAA